MIAFDFILYDRFRMWSRTDAPVASFGDFETALKAAREYLGVTELVSDMDLLSGLRSWDEQPATKFWRVVSCDDNPNCCIIRWTKTDNQVTIE